jgi:hypothetical protein
VNEMTGHFFHQNLNTDSTVLIGGGFFLSKNAKLEKLAVCWRKKEKSQTKTHTTTNAAHNLRQTHILMFNSRLLHSYRVVSHYFL